MLKTNAQQQDEQHGCHPGVQREYLVLGGGPTQQADGAENQRAHAQPKLSANASGQSCFLPTKDLDQGLFQFGLGRSPPVGIMQIEYVQRQIAAAE